MEAVSLLRGCVAALAATVALSASAGRAASATPDGTWLIDHKAAVELFDCSGHLCGRVVWLRNPALRTAALCNRTIVWGLQPQGATQWTGGWFYDPENGRTYHARADLELAELMSARIYQGLPWFGITASLLRIAPRSLRGWC